MRTVKLFWKSRVTKKNKANFIRAAKEVYDEVKDTGEYVEMVVPNECTKFIWLFMLSRMFKDLQ